ncbi:MAG TPA: YihY/virulence factor BrkB family protein [Mycobacteriales bacterium]|jgi:membrane protein|nr:YihY/virulence factor BrkB family protein [Mycobacteriales bacterium]
MAGKRGTSSDQGQLVDDGKRRAGIGSSDDGKRRADYAPAGTDTATTTGATLKRTFKEFSEDGGTDWAASLTYYALLALFPAIAALISIVGLVADPKTTTDKLTEIVSGFAPTAAETLSGPIAQLTANRSSAGVALVVGLAGALWSASGYVGAFTRASNVIYETPEGRPVWKLRPLQVLVTLIVVLLTAVLAISLVLTGPVVDKVAGPLGIGGAAVTAWNIAKWPVMAVLVMIMIGVLYYATPNVKLRGLKFVVPGALLAMAVWLLASLAFAFYVSNFASYNKTYGTLGGVVAFLVWVWITNIALLLGAELTAERERTLELKEGVEGAEKEIQLEPRSEPKDKATT